MILDDRECWLVRHSPRTIGAHEQGRLAEKFEPLLVTAGLGGLRRVLGRIIPIGTARPLSSTKRRTTSEALALGDGRVVVPELAAPVLIVVAHITPDVLR